MAVSYEVFFTPQYQLYLQWLDFWSIFQLYAHRKKLHLLIEWASRKRVSHVYHAYKRRLIDIDRSLFRHRIRSPYLHFFAKLTYFVYDLCIPTR